MSVPVEEFGLGYPPRIARFKKGETIYSLNAIPFGGFNKINQEILEKQSFWKKFLVYTGGVILNLGFGLIILTMIYMAGSKPALIVGKVFENSPAQNVLYIQDQIVSLSCSGEKLSFPFTGEQMKEFIARHQGQKIQMQVNRKGEILSFSLVPRIHYPSNQGPLGIAFVDIGVNKLGFLSAVGQSLKDTFFIFKGTFIALFKLLTQIFFKPGLIKNFMGPVGAVYFSSFAGAIGWIYFLKVVAIVSISLAAINLFPFPAFDGMYLVYLFIEKAKGSPISLKIKEKINTFGFIFLLFLGFIILVKDIILVMK